MGAQASSLIILMIEMEKILRGNWQQIWENLSKVGKTNL